MRRVRGIGRCKSSSRGEERDKPPAFVGLPGFIGVATAAIVIIFILSGISSGSQGPGAASPVAESIPPVEKTEIQPGQSKEVNDERNSIFSRLFGAEPESRTDGAQESGFIIVASAIVKLALAALLAAMLAFRPHKYLRTTQRNPYVAETQILLAVVAAALMMIVGDSAARAFGIFAAASLVRFRTNIRDPKEITVLLINLAIGLAVGVGRWELGITLSLFVLALLWALEFRETRQVSRAMELKIKTHHVRKTEKAVKEVFKRHHFNAEVREMDREDEGHPFGKLAYYVNLSPNISTDVLSEELISADPDNIEAIEWHQKKTASYIYR
jgi:uncharacterized membrane protein YhiD involved in acid resistance